MLPGQVVQVAKSVAPEPTPEVVEGASVEAAGEEKPAKPRARRGRRGRGSRNDEVEQVQEAPKPEQEKAAVEPEAEVAAASPSLKAEEKVAAPARRRRGRGRGAATADEAPEILPGQVASMPSTPAKKKAAAKKTAPAKVAKETAPIEEPVKKGSRTRSRASKPAEPAASEVVPPSFSAGALGLPTELPAIMDYLSTSYKGVGKKTVESLNEAYGADLFRVLEEEPQRVRELLGDRRAGTLLDQWSQDVGGRRPAEAAAPAAEPEAEGETQKPKSRSRRGGRGRGTRKKSDESGS
ncbi:MAG: hypothetical protein H0U67_06470 [Gemmatimonadetes bacterium]|nr:hypothetical protein [Gemmatimonadota bacterium]